MIAPLRILLTGDDPVALQSSAGPLAEAGHVVDLATSAEEALLALEQRPDLAVVHHRLSDAGGGDFLRRIRALQDQAAPFIVLELDPPGSSGAAEAAPGAAADGYLPNPIPSHERDALLKAYVRIVALTKAHREQAARLTEQNQRLHEQRLASLNLMEDALEERDRTEKANQALRESEAQFRSLLEGAPDAVFIHSCGKFLYVNTAACLLFGAGGPADLLGQPIMDRFHASSHALVKERLGVLFDERQPVPIVEQTWLRLDGTEFPADVSAVPVTYEGQASAMVFARGTSERRRQEQERSLTMQVLATLNRDNDINRLIADILELVRASTGIEAVAIRLEESGDYQYCEVEGFPEEFVEAERSLCVFDSDGEIVRDAQGRAVLECMCGNVIRGRVNPALPFFTPAGSFWSSSTSDLLASTTERDRQARTRNRCNREGYESVALIPLRSGSSTIGLLQLNDRRRGQFTRESIEFFESLSASIGIALARRRTMTALRESEARARELLDCSPDGIFVVRTDGRHVEVNPIAAARSGYSREELLDTTMFELTAPDTREQLSEWLARAREEEVQFECRRRSKSGEEYTVEVIARPIVLDGAARLLCVERDTTERRIAEEEKRNLEAQLFQAQKMESIGRLAGGVAHDFNNLLTVINGYSEMSLAGLSPADPLHASLKEIGKAGERAAALTRQLLAFSRKQVLEPRNLDFNQVVAEMRSMLQRLVGESIEITFALDARDSTVHADHHQIEQVIMNLAVNARDAMPDGGSLSFESSNVEFSEDAAANGGHLKAGRYVRLSVRDSGSGMDESTIGRIFEPFYTTKKEGQGTGLGLSMVHGIIAQSGGGIRVESQAGEGTVFRIYLPVLAEAKVDVGQELGGPVLGGNETVLVVEDQAEVRNYAAAVLRAAGYDVMEAENAGEALLRCESESGRISLVLTDAVMPHMSGGELANRLQKLHPEIKVMFMSGYSENTILQPGASGRAASFIQKPFKPADLVRKVRFVLGPPAPLARVLVADDEPAVRTFLRAVLEKGGYEVVEATDGKQAMQLAQHSPVDVVVTDLVMPEQEGIETIRRLRQERPGVGIIAISGAFHGQFLSTAQMLGADAALRKPIAAELLLAKVAQVLQLRPRQ